MRRIPVVTFAALLAISLCAAGCGGGGGSCPPSSPTEPAPPPTITEGALFNGGNDDPLDSLTELVFYPYEGPSLPLTVPGNGIEVDVENDGTYRTDDIPAGMWNIRAVRVGYEMFDEGPVTIVANETTMVPDIYLDPLPPFEYITSLGCAQCHPSQYDIFRRNAHPYKVNKVVNNQAPAYPFTNLPLNILSRIDGAENALGAPDSWSDLSYVIGGYNWKARFMDADGFIITGTEVQYNYETDGMVAYHAGEAPPDKVFNCGNCHTTGWKHTDDALNDNHQDGLEGIVGTWSETGIQCEACHGGGAKHAQTMDDDDIVTDGPFRTTADLQAPMMGYGLAMACGECHTRDGEKDWRGEGDPENFFSNYQLWAKQDAHGEYGGRVSASGGLIKHHEQYDEIIGIDPIDHQVGSTRSGGYLATHGDCLTCHRVHQTTVNQDLSGDAPGVLRWDGDADQPFKATCMLCHSAYDPANRSGGMKDLDCVDCHMPNLAKSAVAHDPVGDGPLTGDIATHLFRIDLGDETEQFSGSFSYPWITADWACRTCHNGVDEFSLGSTGNFTFHNNLNDN